MSFSSTTRICADNNPKVVIRIYIWDGRQKEIELCEKCKKDPDFQDFVKEIPIQEIVA